MLIIRFRLMVVSRLFFLHGIGPQGILDPASSLIEMTASSIRSFNGHLKTLVLEALFIELYSTPASIEVALHFVAFHCIEPQYGLGLHCIELRQKLLKPRRMVISTPILMDVDYDFNFCFCSDSKAIKPQLELKARANRLHRGLAPLISLVLAADVVDCCRSFSAF
jgi:hypothetical protein